MKIGVSKEHAYAYETGYRDGSTHYELEHCPACKNVADLQEALDENAELRKLAKDLHALARDILPERKSDYITICSVESCIDYYSKTMPVIEHHMRKLGIEVPE